MVLGGWWLFCLVKFFGVPRFMFDFFCWQLIEPNRQFQLVHGGVERCSSTISLKKTTVHSGWQMGINFFSFKRHMLHKWLLQLITTKTRRTDLCIPMVLWRVFLAGAITGAGGKTHHNTNQRRQGDEAKNRWHLSPKLSRYGPKKYHLRCFGWRLCSIAQVRGGWTDVLRGTNPMCSNWKMRGMMNSLGQKPVNF